MASVSDGAKILSMVPRHETNTKQQPTTTTTITATKPKKKKKGIRTRKKTTKKATLSHSRSSRLSPDFDLTVELAENRDRYFGDQGISLYTFPNYVRVNLDRIRARVITTNKPGLSPAVTACIVNGLEYLKTLDSVVKLLLLRERLNLDDDADADDITELSSWFSSFTISIPDTLATGSKRQNITLPEHVRMDLASFASELGTHSWSLAVIAIMVTLADQPNTLESHRKHLRQAVDIFMRRVTRRVRVATVLLETL